VTVRSRAVGGALVAATLLAGVAHAGGASGDCNELAILPFGSGCSAAPPTPPPPTAPTPPPPAPCWDDAG